GHLHDLTTYPIFYNYHHSHIPWRAKNHLRDSLFVWLKHKNQGSDNVKTTPLFLRRIEKQRHEKRRSLPAYFQHWGQHRLPTTLLSPLYSANEQQHEGVYSPQHWQHLYLGLLLSTMLQALFDRLRVSSRNYISCKEAFGRIYLSDECLPLDPLIFSIRRRAHSPQSHS